MAIDFGKLLAESRAKASTQQVSQPQNAVPSAPVAPPISSDKQKDSAVAFSTPASQPSTANVSSGSSKEDLGQGDVAEAGSTIEYPGLYELKEKIYALDKALTSNHPAMDSLLQTIHRNLAKDPELVHMLKPEDRAVIFAGMKKKTSTVIVTEAVKSASSGRGKGLKNIGLEDM